MKRLDEIDTVPWGTLTHAYGGADDIPSLLRELAGQAPVRERGGWYDFYGKVSHQGTFYEASVEVVPFLAGFLEGDGFSGDRTRVVMALIQLAGGDGHPAEVEPKMQEALSAALVALAPITSDPVTRLGLLCVSSLLPSSLPGQELLADEDGASLGPLGEQISAIAHELLEGRPAPQAVILRRLLPLRGSFPYLLDGYVDEADWDDPDDFPMREERWDREIGRRLDEIGVSSSVPPRPVEPIGAAEDARIIVMALFEDLLRSLDSE